MELKHYLELSKVQELIKEGNWKELEPFKDQILSGMYAKIVCEVCENTTLHVEPPNPDEYVCQVCKKSKGGIKNYTHCNNCGATFKPSKGERCNCRQGMPLESLRITVDPIVQAARDKAAKQPKGDGSSILMKRIKDFEKAKQDRAERIDKNLEIIAKALVEKGVNNAAI